jgi:spermidine synthase
MQSAETILYEGDSQYEHYQVIDMVYIGRPARVLFSGHHSAAQSGIPRDGNKSMLFDYNQRFLELVHSLMPKNILLIGGGAFTLPMEILKYFPKIKIDVVERDRELKKIAGRFFGLKQDKNLQIFFGDGRKFLASTNNTYDLILIDAFVHNLIPTSLSTNEFVQLVKLKLSKKGVAAVNVISAYHGLHDSVLKQQYATYNSVFRHVNIFPADKTLSLWISQNFLIISTDKRIQPKYNMRFAQLQPPVISGKNILHDKKSQLL